MTPRWYRVFFTCRACRGARWVEDEFVDYGSAGAGWNYARCPCCDASGYEWTVKPFWLNSLAKVPYEVSVRGEGEV